MVLVFREKDFEIINNAALSLNFDLVELIIKSGLVVNYFGNIYQNSQYKSDYSSVKTINIEMMDENFEIIVKKANKTGLPVEIFILESVKMYVLMFSEVYLANNVNK